MPGMKDLKPFDMPLDGIALIEASAGTGKTYNITSLYLRQLLEKKLTVDQILVVTFTKAATEELRDRIRKRVAQALEFLETNDRQDCLDNELADWLYGRDNAVRDTQLLRAALVSMDEAAVFTIHGYCQRVLQENAFDTGMAFDLEFIESEDLLRQQAAEDFWRQWFGKQQLPYGLAGWLLNKWPDPNSILSRVSTRLESQELQLVPESGALDELVKAIAEQLNELDQCHEAVRDSWASEEQAVRQILDKRDGLNKGSYKEGSVEQAIADANALCMSHQPPLAVGDKFPLLTTSILQKRTNKTANTPENPFFDRCDDYVKQLDTLSPLLDDLNIAFLKKARDYIRQHLDTSKRHSRQLYFNDLLTQLDMALQSAQGERLVQQLRTRFPVAMIDEFQDTDAVQYCIFISIYGQNAEDTGLYLIGDPKQAIYGFRGGDIFTYMQAAKDAQRRYSLGTNWRSSSRLVAAVNHLFQCNDNPFIQESITYQAVQPCATADDEPLLIEGLEPRPLHFWKIHATEDNAKKGKIRVGDAREEAANHCANHIGWLLDPGRTRLGTTQLEAKDIAVLVRSHKHADIIQEALRNKGINSVTLSDGSVFQTEEAASVLALLRSVVECQDEKLLRYALAGRLLGFTAGEIDALLENDSAWEELQRRFFEYRRQWQEQGFVQAFQQLFKQEAVARRLLSLKDGERRLTNLLQLVELLQQASVIRSGMQELLRWLADEIELAGKAEAAKLRLESDEGLVKIVTMHASKGLEYPVVYIPFPWNDPQPRGKGLPWFFHDEEDEPFLYLGGGDSELESKVKQRKEREAMSERMRLFYVSITRAAKLCVLTWGKINNADKTGLAWLLHPGSDGKSALAPLTEEEIFDRLDGLAKTAPDAIEVSEPPALYGAIESEKGTRTALEAQLFTTNIERNWRVNSYSSLIRGRESERPDYDSLPATRDTPAPSHDLLQALPAGSRFGLFLHQLLENLDFTRVEKEPLYEEIGRLAYRFRLPEIHGEKVDAVATLVNNLLDTELSRAGLKLRMLAQQNRVNEMEFHFDVGNIGYRKLQQMLAHFPDWEDAASQLNFTGFQGLMHGFIDLVFRHDGRYYLADYKSNRLDDYGEAGVMEAMRVHHYSLQGLIYALALHRYLGLRLPDYDYEHHFGGIGYLFARGMRPGSHDGIWFRLPDKVLIEALDECFGRRQVA